MVRDRREKQDGTETEEINYKCEYCEICCDFVPVLGSGLKRNNGDIVFDLIGFKCVKCNKTKRMQGNEAFFIKGRWKWR